MIRRLLISIVVIAIVLATACNRHENPSAVAEPQRPADTFVNFDLEPVKSADGAEQWIGTYRAQGKVAKFRIDFGLSESKSVKNAADINFGEGTLLPEQGSDASVLLADLQKAMQAKTSPAVPAEKKSVPFSFANLGDRSSQGGTWKVRKLTFGDGDRQSEVFLNIDTAAKKGQFSMKDPSYGDLLLAELAKVL